MKPQRCSSFNGCSRWVGLWGSARIPSSPNIRSILFIFKNKLINHFNIIVFVLNRVTVFAVVAIVNVNYVIVLILIVILVFLPVISWRWRRKAVVLIGFKPNCIHFLLFFLCLRFLRPLCLIYVHIVALYLAIAYLMIIVVLVLQHFIQTFGFLDFWHLKECFWLPKFGFVNRIFEF